MNVLVIVFFISSIWLLRKFAWNLEEGTDEQRELFHRFAFIWSDGVYMTNSDERLRELKGDSQQAKAKQLEDFQSGPESKEGSDGHVKHEMDATVKQENLQAKKLKDLCSMLKKDVDAIDKKRRDFNVLMKHYAKASLQPSATDRHKMGNKDLTELAAILDEHVTKTEDYLAEHMAVSGEEAMALITNIENHIPRGKALLTAMKLKMANFK